MRALALAGPRASERHVARFAIPQIDELITLFSPTSEEVARALNPRPDVVLIFGGDGTVNVHLNHLALTAIPVMVVATGSGNDLARSAGMNTAEAALGRWTRYLDGDRTTTSVDLGRISSPALAQPRYFSCCANIGLDADAARRTDRMPDWLKSRGGYFLGGLAALSCYRPDNISVIADGRSIFEPAWFASISNTPTFGGGLKIAPQASVTDGELDITFASARNFSRASLAKHFPKILAGRHVGLPGLEIFRAKHIVVETPSPQIVYADGEFITQTPCEIDTAPHALRLVTASVL